MKEVDSTALNYSRLYLNDAFKRFFKSQAKHPKKHYWQNYGSYTTYNTNAHDNTSYIRNGKLWLPKLGLVKVVWHRKFEGQIKHVTVSKTPADEYYVAICTEVSYDLPIKKNITDPEKVIGIDMAMNGLAVYSDGTSADMPKMYKSKQQKIAHLHRELSRRVGSKKGQEKSKNFEKTRKKICRLQRDITNSRKDFLNKESSKIIKSYDIAVVEDINLQEMASRKDKKGNTKKKMYRFGKSISDNGFGEFRAMLDYKFDRKGGELIKAESKYASTQLCSTCGFKNIELRGIEGLKIREWTCPNCGTYHDRDINAAKNLKKYYLGTKKC